MAMDPKLAQLLLETFNIELQEIHQSMIDGLLNLEKEKNKTSKEEILKELFRHSHNMKGAAGSAGVKPIAEMAHRLEDLFSKWQTTQQYPNRDQIQACLEVIDNILLVFQHHLQGNSIDIENYLAPLTGGKTVHIGKNEVHDKDFIKLPILKLEQASAKANELLTYRLQLANWLKRMEQLQNEVFQRSQTDSLLAPALEQLASINEDGGAFLGEFSRSIQALQEELKSMRMVPISTLLIPLKRTVYELANTLNKSVELIIHGGDIELDKTILDAIKEPLQHLIRNAIDHGIEPDNRRQELNKPIPAKLTIQVTQSAGKIKLTISDDGQGMDLTEIKKHAVARGIYSKEEVENLNEDQIINCIFKSGFSLQETVTQISGRGVGLDAVKNDIHAIKGTVNVVTQKDKGSLFTIMLPLTLATTRGLFCKVNGQVFMIPTLSLTSLFELKFDELHLVDNHFVLLKDGVPIPLIMTAQLLYNHGSETLPNICYGLLIELGSKRVLFVVDEILNEHDCVVKPLPFPLSKIQRYIGFTLTGDSDLVLVLDPVNLMEVNLSEKTYHYTNPHKPHREVVKKRVLVVDDALTTRSLCANGLEAAGYEVLTAVNGKKAWDLLQKETVDCIITDIVMPEMDGFVFTKLVKTDKKLAHIPIIIVSQLDSKKDKEKGLESGANAFLVKSEFDTNSLLLKVESLL